MTTTTSTSITTNAALPAARAVFEAINSKDLSCLADAVTHLRNRTAIGPEGFPIDWHGVRVIYRVSVAVPTGPVVTDIAGSTDAAAWFHPAELARLPMTEVVVTALAHLTSTNVEEMTEVDSSATLGPDV